MANKNGIEAIERAALRGTTRVWRGIGRGVTTLMKSLGRQRTMTDEQIANMIGISNGDLSFAGSARVEGVRETRYDYANHAATD